MGPTKIHGGHLLSSATRVVAAVLLCTIFSGCSIFSGSSNSGSSRLSRAAGSAVHIVRPGETLWEIGRQYQISHQRIAEANGIDDPRELEVGARLIIPTLRSSGVKTAQLHRFQEQSSNSLRQYQSTGARLRFPLESGRIVSSFGPRSGSFHDGIDVAAPTGTEIHAAHGGTVAYSGDEISGYGNLLIIKNDIGIMTIYAHNDRVFVRGGDKVKRGDLIAEVGATGHASGPHLHFEVRMRDHKEHYVAVDPMPFFEAGSTLRPRYRVNESLTPLVTKILD